MTACYIQPWVGLTNGRQIKMARDALDLTQKQFAQAAGVGVKTLHNLETAGRNLRGRIDSLMKVQALLDKHRFECIDDDRGFGVIQKPIEPCKKR